VVQSAIEQAMPLLQGNHALQTRMASHAIAVRGDRARLIQVVVNLLNNAARYTPAPGTIVVDVALLACPPTWNSRGRRASATTWSSLSTGTPSRPCSPGNDLSACLHGGLIRRA